MLGKLGSYKIVVWLNGVELSGSMGNAGATVRLPAKNQLQTGGTLLQHAGNASSTQRKKIIFGWSLWFFISDEETVYTTMYCPWPGDAHASDIVWAWPPLLAEIGLFSGNITCQWTIPHKWPIVSTFLHIGKGVGWLSQQVFDRNSPTRWGPQDS